jgi:hypothetical protein
MGLTRGRKLPTSYVALGWSKQIGRGMDTYHRAHRNALAALLHPTCCSGPACLRDVESGPPGGRRDIDLLLSGVGDLLDSLVDWTTGLLLAVTAAWAAALRTLMLRPAFGRWGWLSLSVVAIDHASLQVVV